jgi:hypothetical protein
MLIMFLNHPPQFASASREIEPLRDALRRRIGGSHGDSTLQKEDKAKGYYPHRFVRYS